MSDEKSHLPAGTLVRLTRELNEEQHACTGLILPEGCHGVLVDEDGDIGFRPQARGFETWCCYLGREDYQATEGELDE